MFARNPAISPLQSSPSLTSFLPPVVIVRDHDTDATRYGDPVSPSRGEHDVYLEVGTKRVFAGAIGWPGWCRSGRDADAALQALVAYAYRYEKVVHDVRPAFRPAGAIGDLHVVERLTGDATTDFGAPSIAPAVDARAIDAKELDRLESLLRACWSAFDLAAASALGKELTKGPRGGGRDLNAIVWHVVNAEVSYAGKLGAGAKRPKMDDDRIADFRDDVRAVILEALSRALTDGLPETGPRGGKMWTPPYFVRRAAWHVADHLWEIQDRSGPAVSTG
jgi:hypothetical protein